MSGEKLLEAAPLHPQAQHPRWGRAFQSTRSHIFFTIPEKNPLLLLPKRPVSDEVKSQTEIAPRPPWGIGNTKYMHYTVTEAAPMPAARGFGEYFLYFSNKRGEGMTFCQQGPISLFFFFFSF